MPNSLVMFNWKHPFWANLVQKIKIVSLKVVFTTFLLVCFLCLKENTCELGKMLLLHFKSSFFSRKPNFRFLDIQILWCYQVPKHKTRNTFYWINRSKHSLLVKLGQFTSYYKRTKLSKNFAKTVTWKLVPGPYVLQKN